MAGIRALLVLLLTQPVFACYPHPNLMLCWDMQDGEALKVKDSAGSRFGQDGTMTGTVAWVPAQKPRGINQNFANSSASGTYADPGDFMVSFPGSAGNNVGTVTDATQFNFPGTVPFEIGFTMAPSALNQAGSPELVSNAAAGEGWQLHYQGSDRHFVFYILGVATYDFGYGDATDNGIIVQDLNPHRVFFARNASHIYLFVDGKLRGDKTLVPGTINAGSNPLTIAGNAAATGQFTGKVSRLSVYNFSWATMTEIETFAKNEYLYWQGMNDGKEDEL